MNIKNYIDITKEWINNATPNSHEIKEQLFFKDENETIHKVDGKNVVLDYSKQEKENDVPALIIQHDYITDISV